MLVRPRLKAHLRAAIAPPDLVFFLRDIGYTVQEGRLLPLLMPLLDGRRTVDEILGVPHPEVAPSDVLYGLSLLERLDLLEEASAPGPKTKLAAGGRLVDLLRRLAGPSGGEVEIVLTDDYDVPELHQVAHTAIDRDGAWMPARPGRERLWIGPLFRARGAACWECLVHRLRSNRPEQAFLRAIATDPKEPSRRGKGVLSADDIATSIERLEGALADGLDRLSDGEMITVERDHSWETHVLVPRAACRRCGDRRAAQRPTSSYRLADDGEVASTDGGYRSVPPQITLERYRRLVSPAIGIVSSLERLAPRTAEELAIFAATLPTPEDAVRRELVHHGLRRRTAGKGLSRAQAEASALCEALERWSGRHHPGPIFCRGTFEEMEGKAIDPTAAMSFSDRQYEERDRWNALGRRYLRVPRRFDPTRPIDWVPLRSLTHRRHRFLPASLCYYAHPEAEREGSMADSNGCAAGNTVAEAVLQGLLELVERECVAIWWYNRIARPTVAPEALDRSIAAQSEPHRALGRSVRIFDITHDLAIPCFAVVSWARGRPGKALLLGAGAHPDPQIAIARAATEMNQFLPGLVAGALRPLYAGASLDPGFLDAVVHPTVDPGPSPPPPESVAAAVDDCVQRLARRDLEVLVLEQTRPEVGLPVVRVVVPGLRHFWPRFAPGRLYDVPVKLGWLPEPRTESDLNPAWIVI